MPTSVALPPWEQVVLEADPRARDFRQDFYQESTPVETPRRRRGTGQMATRRSTDERIREMCFRLKEASQHMCLMLNELATARRLCVNLLKERQSPPTPTKFPERVKAWAKKARRTVMCKKCDTLGHHWMDCWSPLCSCGEWHSEHSKPRPTCARVNRAATRAVGTGRPVHDHPVPIFGPAGPKGWLSASADEGGKMIPCTPESHSPTVRW